MTRVLFPSNIPTVCKPDGNQGLSNWVKNRFYFSCPSLIDDVNAPNAFARTFSFSRITVK